MNHQKVYDKIIEKAKSENRKKLRRTNSKYVYYENHHILPKCLGGSNDKENLVLLTAKEHYLCHKILTYIYSNNKKIGMAFFYMSYARNSDINISSIDYAYAKELSNRYVWNRGLTKYTSEIIKQQGKERSKQFKEGAINTLNFGIKTEQGLKNISLAQQKPKSEKHKQNISIALSGRSLSVQTRNNMSKARKGVSQQKIQCPYCKMWGGTTMHRWHFENCKNKNNGTT